MARFLAPTHATGTAVASILDVASALHLQTILADFERAVRLGMGRAAAAACSNQSRLQKCQNIQSAKVNNRYSGGFVENQGYNWLSGSQSGQLHALASVPF
jgi:hypothetical protein